MNWMPAAVFSLLGLLAGAALVWLARLCPRDDHTLSAKVNALLPQTQCAQCGYPGCEPYARAIADGEADIDRCPPGGEQTIAALAVLLGVAARPLAADLQAPPPGQVAVIDESQCIGCALCLPACPVDAIVGAPKHMHTVLAAECTGCELCIPACPVDCIAMVDGAHEQAAPRTAPGAGLPEPRAALVRLLAAADLRGMGGAGYPTWRKLAALGDRPLEVFIVNAVECEPGLGADRALLREQAVEVVSGIAGITEVMAPQRTVFACKAQDLAWIRAVLHEAGSACLPLEWMGTPGDYPQGDERALTRRILGHRLARGQRPTAAGVLVLNVHTVAAVAAVKADGHAPLQRKLTVHGPMLPRPLVVDARIGERFDAVLERAGVKPSGADAGLALASGGAMMRTPAHGGSRVGLHTTGIYLPAPPDTARVPAPCIHCQRCVLVCPEAIPVAHLVGWLQRAEGAADEVANLDAVAECTGCRCCDVVCPSGIAIAGLLRDTHAASAREASSRAEAARLQARYEAHTARSAQRARPRPARAAAGGGVDALLASARARRERRAGGTRDA